MKLRAELEALPARLHFLPVDERGYPVPWFVAWRDGKPEFRAMDGEKWVRAVAQRLCWVCGEQLGNWLTFVIGPMCGITRTTGEPPCHLDCARWSARNCPFLSRPHMVRREDGLPDNIEIAGIAISRNPGVTLLWTTRTFDVFDDGNGKGLISVGDPERVEWWAEGRPATREEVEHSVETGIPILQGLAEQDERAAMDDLDNRRAWIKTLYPPPVAAAEDIRAEAP